MKNSKILLSTGYLFLSDLQNDKIIEVILEIPYFYKLKSYFYQVFLGL